MDSVVKAVNFIKRSALQTRLFASLCAAAGEEHTTLLYHSEVRWLSRGSVLSRVFELRASIHEFLLKHCTELAASSVTIHGSLNWLIWRMFSRS